MSNSSPAEASPPDSRAVDEKKVVFDFNSGNDAQLHAFNEARLQLSNKHVGLARKADKDLVTESSDPTATSTSSDSAMYALMPTIPGDVHQPPGPTASAAAEDASVDEKARPDQSHVALELESPVAADETETGRQDIYLPSQDLQMTVRFVRRSNAAFALYIVGSILTVGLLALIANFWAPQLYRKWVYRSREAPSEAEVAQLKKITCLVKITSEPACKESLEVKRFSSPVDARKIFSSNLRIPLRAKGDLAQGVPPAELSQDDEGTAISAVHILNFRHTPLIYHAASRKLVSLAEWRDADLGETMGGPQPLSQAEVEFRRMLFGRNLIDVKGQTLIKLIVDECLHPFYVFTLASCGLWLYDTYQVYAGVVLAISILGISATVIQAKRSQNRLQQMSRSFTEVSVLRATETESGSEAEKASLAAEWKMLPSTDIVPGDIVSISDLVSQSLPADMLLLKGSNVIVNESMLTGESTPSSKNPISSVALDGYASGERSDEGVEKSLLWGGTSLLRATSDESDKRATAVVVATAWNSSKGSLIKMMLFPKPIKFAFYKDAFLFIMILVVICCVGFIGSVVNFVIQGVDGGEIGLRTIDLFTICVPPALPAAMSLCTSFALRRLKRASIFCISPQRITLAGKITVAVFDKTGTLTETGLDVRGVRLPTSQGTLGPLSESVEELAEPAKDVTMEEAMAVTHDVNYIDGEALGDPLEVSMLLYTKWTTEATKRALQGGEASGHVQCTRSRLESGPTVAVLRKLDFSPILRRMSVITQSSSRPESTIYVKGAPESIVPLCDPATVPDDFDLILNDATRKGLRVLAFGCKRVSLSWQGAQRCSREFVESHLDFLGLLFFENKLKGGTSAAIAELHEANIPTKMCTGDAVNTAIAVAREAGIIPLGQPVFVPRLPDALKADKSLGGMSDPAALVWTDVDMPCKTEEQSVGSQNGGLDPYSLAPRDPSLSLSTVGLALTGTVFEHLLTHASQETIARLLVRAQVFARFSPELKAELVERLQEIGHTVAFTGDGANDTGALKGADIGLSLSDAEASVAAPFTSANDDISSLLDLMKEGRNCLATSTSLFKFLAVYSINEYFAVILLFGAIASLNNAQYIFVDVFMVFGIATGMALGAPASRLSKQRPSSRLMTREVLFSLLGALVLLILALTVPYVVLHKQSWYVKPEFQPSDLSLENQDNTAISKTMWFTYIIASLAWNVGPPHRQPLYKNVWLTFGILALAGITIAALFSDDESNGLVKLFGFQHLPVSFLFVIFGTVLVQALCAFVWEFWLVKLACEKSEGPMRRYRLWRAKGRTDANVVEKRYRSIERALQMEEAHRTKVAKESAAGANTSPCPSAVAHTTSRS
ncbi:unnamed protein product [Parajaminaea phylloscopi]